MCYLPRTPVETKDKWQGHCNFELMRCLDMILTTHLKHLLGLSLLLMASLFTPTSALSQQTQGCYNIANEAFGERPDFRPSTVTQKDCQTFCSGLARKYAGWRPNVSQCYCGNELNIKGSGFCRPPRGRAAEVGIKCTDVLPKPDRDKCNGGILTIVDLLGVPPVTRPGDALGNIWYESEFGWSGVWIRRPGTNVFDATWTMGATRVQAVLAIQIQGNAVTVRRQQPNGQTCDYSGTLDGGGRTVSGSYSCQWARGPFAWNARIDQQPAAPIPLGSVWNETEQGWTGRWQRRGNSNVFDAFWTRGSLRERAVLTIQVQGGVVSVHRRQPNGQTCSYSGVVYGGPSVMGSYTCQWALGPFSWQATIQP